MRRKTVQQTGNCLGTRSLVQAGRSLRKRFSTFPAVLHFFYEVFLFLSARWRGKKRFTEDFVSNRINIVVGFSRGLCYSCELLSEQGRVKETNADNFSWVMKRSYNFFDWFTIARWLKAVYEIQKVFLWLLSSILLTNFSSI